MVPLSICLRVDLHEFAIVLFIDSPTGTESVALSKISIDHLVVFRSSLQFSSLQEKKKYAPDFVDYITTSQSVNATEE